MTNLTAAFSRADTDTEPVVEVPAGGVWVCEDGQVYAVDRTTVAHVACHCTDETHVGYGAQGAPHMVRVHTYSLTTAVR